MVYSFLSHTILRSWGPDSTALVSEADEQLGSTVQRDPHHGIKLQNKIQLLSCPRGFRWSLPLCGRTVIYALTRSRKIWRLGMARQSSTVLMPSRIRRYHASV
jgi:hypothetical protein